MSDYEFGGSDWTASHFGCMFGEDEGAEEVEEACEDVMIGADVHAAERRFRHGRHEHKGLAHRAPAHKARRWNPFGEDETDADVIGVYGWLSGVQFGMVDDDVYGALVAAEESDPYALGL